jgi:tetratricopeptide (TPR) repeat protein
VNQSDEQRVVELIESIVDSKSTPEQACIGCPELLPKVRERLKLLRRVEAEIDVIFPAAQPYRHIARLPRIDVDFPRIPGYEILEVLGHGGMGVVYKALHQKLNRVVALKMLLAGVYSSNHQRKRFIREAEAIAQLKHSNLVQVYDIGDVGHCPYFTMEFIPAGSLAKKLAGAPQPPRFASQIVATLASAIHAVHEGGVIHRDLKPSNVLLCADGSPKIADFGLARYVESGPDMTRSDARVGTPCYMSPEQVTHRPGAVGPLADLYALGAILYEMLTGRPPFRGETAADTERQILTDEPIPPSRLNSKVPRDLETICLKCLQKDPKRRYATCAALAEDLRRYERGEAVLARPMGRIAKTAKWIRRRPAHTILIAGGIAVWIASIGGAFWFVSARAARSRVVDRDLREATELEEDGSWSQARTALLRARIELGNHGPQSLHDRLETHEHELALVAQMDQLELHYPNGHQGALNIDHSFQDFADAFRDAGLGSLDEDPALAALRIQHSPVRKALLNALYIELVMTPRPWQLEIARKADPDPTGWRDRALDPGVWNQPASLKELLVSVKMDTQPATLLLAVTMRYTLLGGDGAPFFRKLQMQYPNEFWTNLKLGEMYLERNQIANSIRYLQAAVSIQPTAAIAEDNLAIALSRAGNLDEAIAHYRNAIRLDPTTAVDHCNLGLFLDESGNHIEAIEESKRAVALEPNNDWFHTVLGGCYRADGQKAEARVEYEKAISIKPQSEAALSGLNACLQQPMSAEQRRARWETLLDANPPQYQAWDGYAEFCLFLGQPDKYRKARTALLKQFGNTTDPRTAELVGRACLLLPGSEEETQSAVALIDRAMSADAWTIPPSLRRYFNLAKSIADYRQGKYQSAVNRLQGANAMVLVPVPQLVLAMSYCRLGNISEANRSLSQAVQSTNWTKARATDATAWICHALRHEAEALLGAGSKEQP